MEINELSATVKQANIKFKAVKEEIGKVIVGQTEMVDRLLLALLADGHILLEGLPGLAKTLAATTLAKAVQCEHKRIQFTPDLLPADLIGTQIYNPRDSTFSINKGPIFTNILIADEINRAPAKVQSALLEVMQERQVTISNQTFFVGNPYLVLATQNPIEQEGTYPLPEAQTDRFMMKVKIGYPSREEESAIYQRMGTLHTKPTADSILSAEDILNARLLVNQIYVDEKIKEYILNIIFATRDPKQFGIDLEGMLLFGASPRATLAMKIGSQAHAFLMGRAYVTPHDIKQIAPDILRHRLRRTYEAEAQGLSSDDIIDRVLNHLPIP
jgi:MoxR-like ATPase